MRASARLRVLKAPDVDPLSAAEKNLLRDCELTIGRGIGSWFEVGRARQAIHQRRLWRASHATFGAYLRDRWGIGPSRAYQLVRAFTDHRDDEAPPASEIEARRRRENGLRSATPPRTRLCPRCRKPMGCPTCQS